MQPEIPETLSAPSNWATLALLRTYFDRGATRSDLFAPFVHDAVADHTLDAINPEAVALIVRNKWGLSMPTPVVVNVLRRLQQTRKGILLQNQIWRVDPDRFTRPDLEPQRLAVDEAFSHFVSRFHAYSDRLGIARVPDEELKSALVGFVDIHLVALLQNATLPSVATKTVGHHLLRTLLSFIRSEATSDETVRRSLRVLVEGALIRNALMLRDLPSETKNLGGLQVFLDTRFVLHTIGLAEPPIVDADRESIRLLREAGAKTKVFDKTITEIRGVLNVYVSGLATAESVARLRQTELTRFFLTRRHTPSDVAQLVADLEQLVSAQHISVVEAPPHQRDYTEDERDLIKMLSAEGEDFQPSHRAQHDVDCVAGVLTIRRGVTADRLSNAVAVFATTTGLVVHNVGKWYAKHGLTGLQPTIHVSDLTAHAWMMNPTAVPELKLHELVAACAVALRPSEEQWNAMLGYLNRQLQEGKLASQQFVAVLISDRTDEYLAESQPNEPDPAASFSEIVDRVVGHYRAAGAQEAERITGEYGAQLTRIRTEKDVLQATNRNLRDQAEAYRATLEHIIRGASWIASRAFMVCAIVVFLIGSVLAIPACSPVETWVPTALLYLVMVACFVLQFFDSIFGFSASSLRDGIRNQVEAGLRRKLLPDGAAALPSYDAPPSSK